MRKQCEQLSLWTPTKATTRNVRVNMGVQLISYRDHVVENEKSAHCIYFHNGKSSLGDQKDLAKVNDFISLSMWRIINTYLCKSHHQTPFFHCRVIHLVLGISRFNFSLLKRSCLVHNFFRLSIYHGTFSETQSILRFLSKRVEI